MWICLLSSELNKNIINILATLPAELFSCVCGVLRDLSSSYFIFLGWNQ
jgi:hypothetical protein